MPVNPQIVFRDLDHSDAVEAQVRRRAEELEEFSDRISSCRVTIEADHQHHRQGNLFRVRVDVAVPGKHIVVNRNPDAAHAHEDIYVTIRDAFNAVKRQLQDHMRRMDGVVKLHEEPSMGRVTKLFPDRGYGFLATPDGTEIYMHRNSVLGNGFDKLKPGDRVRYVMDEKEGEQGAQASTVVPLNNR